MADDILKFNFSDEDYKKAADLYSKEFLMMPRLKCQDVLKFMTGLPGIRGRYRAGSAESQSQLAPFKAKRKSANDVMITFRTLETFQGNVVEDFVPDEVIRTLLGRGAGALGDSQKNAPSAKLVIACMMASLGEHLREALFTAKRVEDGDTTAELFDGWMTIVEQEIENGNIAEKNGNLITLTDAITSANAVELLKDVDRSLDPHLRALNKFVYCAPEVVDAYNDNYLITHGGVAYNTQFEQPVLEGSQGKTKFVPLDILAGTDKMIISTKENMLYGYDNMGDVERVQVDRFAAFVLTLSASMFFGTQLSSIDKRYFTAVKLANAQ
jgi:hypothetical protein